ncbi:hypothetical protein BDA99DRAFT_510818 [Phascolomyces articulosus]|uniref:Uncharacterized protein n=1 Tax=Phascolomyces articulosus TaxID=60185 RepID=A0AAD5KCW8_9FUNG|nr:hypothetical protein BDA99DRAFT_510818 [Phascolomyces articulosus]
MINCYAEVALFECCVMFILSPLPPFSLSPQYIFYTLLLYLHYQYFVYRNCALLFPLLEVFQFCLLITHFINFYPIHLSNRKVVTIYLQV